MRLFAATALIVFAALASADDHGAKVDLYEQGAELAKACIACHTASGAGTGPAFPNLGGQGFRYLHEQLKWIQSGDRSIPEMTGQLDKLSDQDLKALAKYFSDQPMATGSTDPELLDQGRRIYMGGSHERGIPACTACHSPTGSGTPAAAYPALSGQSSQYVAKALRNYRFKRRIGGENQIMATISARLTEQEIDAVASYVSGLRKR
ncbi:MAG: cytochrome c4 [Gammaproteobacteria bacterium AqS3]|nr:cytochrome c4 [Gammaproteobacteria bacterium AqS3]